MYICRAGHYYYDEIIKKNIIKSYYINHVLLRQLGPNRNSEYDSAQLDGYDQGKYYAIKCIKVLNLIVLINFNSHGAWAAKFYN